MSLYRRRISSIRPGVSLQVKFHSDYPLKAMFTFRKSEEVFNSKVIKLGVFAKKMLGAKISTARWFFGSCHRVS